MVKKVKRKEPSSTVTALSTSDLSKTNREMTKMVNSPGLVEEATKILLQSFLERLRKER